MYDVRGCTIPLLNNEKDVFPNFTALNKRRVPQRLFIAHIMLQDQKPAFVFLMTKHTNTSPYHLGKPGAVDVHTKVQTMTRRNALYL